MKNRIYRSIILTLPLLALMTLIFTYWASAAERNRPESPLASERASTAKPNNTGTLRIIAFGAHPDDCEIKAGSAISEKLTDRASHPDVEVRQRATHVVLEHWPVALEDFATHA